MAARETHERGGGMVKKQDRGTRSRAKGTPGSGKRTSPPDKAAGKFTAEERAAMKERARELKSAARDGVGGKSADGEREVLAKIAEMPEGDRSLAERLHALVRAKAPELSPRTWYGMPAYARHGDVVCFFQGARKFKTRYATLGFSDKAHLDEGAMWPTAFALTELTADGEARIAALLKRALTPEAGGKR